MKVRLTAGTLMTGALAIFACLVALEAGGAPPAGQAEEAQAEEAQAEKAQAEKAQAKSPGRRMADRPWWNQPKKIEALSLTDEQRGELDALAESCRAEQQAKPNPREVYQEMADALTKGDLDAARKLTDSLADAAAKNARAQAQMMIEGVAVLSTDQRGILASEWPGMFRRPWIGAGKRGMMGKQGAARQGQ